MPAATAGMAPLNGPSQSPDDRWFRRPEPRRALARRSDPVRSARNRQLGAFEQRIARIAISRHIFGGRKVGADPLQRDPDQFAALDALQAPIPVRKPLRGNTG